MTTTPGVVAVPSGTRHMNHTRGDGGPSCGTTIDPGIARDIPCPCGAVVWRYAGDEDPQNAQRNASSQRYILDHATKKAHDDWYKGEECNTDDIANPVFKPSIPAGYELCRHCERRRNERHGIRTERPGAGVSTIDRPEPSPPGSAGDRPDGSVAGDDRPGTGSAPDGDARAGGADGSPGEDRTARAEAGAQADAAERPAFFLPPEPGDDVEAPDVETPTGQAITRSRSNRRA